MRKFRRRRRGLGHLLAHGCLRELSVFGTPNVFFIERSEEERLELEVLQLQSLETDDVAGALAAPFCGLLSSSLTSLSTDHLEMERFTEEQDEALQLLTSLEQLVLSGCGKLQCLPAGLQKLTKLKTLQIPGSPAIIHSLRKSSLPDSLRELEISEGDIRALPKDSIPNSLRILKISVCLAIRSLPKESLPTCLQELEINCCPSIMALPKGGLPSSLRVLDVRYGNREELRRQCRKLVGTIPIVKID
jgi:hypothetical protein